MTLPSLVLILYLTDTNYNDHYTIYFKHPYTGRLQEYNDTRISRISSKSPADFPSKSRKMSKSTQMYLPAPKNFSQDPAFQLWSSGFCNTQKWPKKSCAHRTIRTLDSKSWKDTQLKFYKTFALPKLPYGCETSVICVESKPRKWDYWEGVYKVRSNRKNGN